MNTAESATVDCGIDASNETDAPGPAIKILTLIEEKRAELLAYLRRMRLETEDAEDVIQDTCIRVITARAVWRDDKSAFAFIYKIAQNLARDRFRERKRNRFYDHVEIDDTVLPSAWQDPADEIAESDAAVHIEKALSRLTPRCRVIMSLHYHQDLSFRCIGTQLGISKKTVERDILFARRFCAEVMDRTSMRAAA
jgi:RNA polymerase sigma factor CnrH